MRLERENVLKASSYQRTEGRTGYANGFKERHIQSRVGELELQIPQTRNVEFYPSCLERGLRSERAIKLHTELDLSGNLPCFLLMSNGKMSDIRAAKENIPILPDSIYTFDKGYYDLNWFQAISIAGAFFVTRIKNNAQIEFLGQHSEPNKKLGVLRDEIIWFTGFQSVKKYPGELRLIEFRDEESRKTYQFITNNFRIAASSIAEIYKQRWQIELFFKWIKQNLKIKSFLGISENAVMSQIWMAMIHYLLIAYLKFLHGFKEVSKQSLLQFELFSP